MITLPESASLPEVIRALNEIIRSVGHSDPSVNDRAGQASPGRKDIVPGKLAWADGTKWNPGSGEGLYVYTSAGVWEKL
jgi:hypothetical protein